MTYAAFLLQFLVVPILILGVLAYRNRHRLLTGTLARDSCRRRWRWLPLP